MMTFFSPFEEVSGPIHCLDILFAPTKVTLGSAFLQAKQRNGIK